MNRIANPHIQSSRIANAAELEDRAIGSGEFVIRPQ